MDERLSCSTIARVMGVSSSTVREWERSGLLGTGGTVRLESRDIHGLYAFISGIFPHPTLSTAPWELIRDALRLDGPLDTFRSRR